MMTGTNKVTPLLYRNFLRAAKILNSTEKSLRITSVGDRKLFQKNFLYAQKEDYCLKQFSFLQSHNLRTYAIDSVKERLFEDNDIGVDYRTFREILRKSFREHNSKSDAFNALRQISRWIASLKNSSISTQNDIRIGVTACFCKEESSMTGIQNLCQF